MVSRSPRTEIVGNISDIIAFLKATHKKRKPYAATQDMEAKKRRDYYNRFLNLEEGEDYYKTVAICRMIYLDLKRGTNLRKLSRYAPGIESIKPSEIKKIRYDNGTEDYVVTTSSDKYRIYKGDIKYIYPTYCKIPDSQEFELVFEDGRMYVVSKFLDTEEIPVFEM
ncbi:MAG: hypothetical protein ACXQTP_04065 [Candidatus Methanofastidiosia archaeon]